MKFLLIFTILLMKTSATVFFDVQWRQTNTIVGQRICNLCIEHIQTHFKDDFFSEMC